jgi:hypothetical protein
VRAAIVTHCPSLNTATVTNAPKYTIKDPSNVIRCTAADNIQVHVRVEQVFQTAGEPPINPIDTVVDRKNAASISLEQIIRQKQNGACLPGMQGGASGCHY